MTLTEPPEEFSKTESGILIPNPEIEAWKKIRRNEESELQKQYEENEELKALADKIHHSRLLSGPACHQCIYAAILKLEKQKQEAA